jgi:hypothetical protein
MSNSIRAASLQARRLVDQVSARRRGEPVQSPSPTFGDTYPWLIDQGTTVLPAEVHAPFSELLDELGVVTCADLARVHVQDFLDLRGAGPGVLGKLRHLLAQPRGPRRLRANRPGTDQRRTSPPPGLTSAKYPPERRRARLVTVIPGSTSSRTHRLTTNVSRSRRRHFVGDSDARPGATLPRWTSPCWRRRLALVRELSNGSTPN